MKKYLGFILLALLTLSSNLYAQTVVVGAGDLTTGGTGFSSCTDGGFVLGSGTDPLTCTAVLADSEILVGDGTTDPVAESGATLRTSLGLGAGDSPTFDALTLTGSQLLISDGTEAVPSMSFGSSPTTGFRLQATSNISMSLGGSDMYIWDTGNFSSNVAGGFKLRRLTGAMSIPNYAFSGDADTGMFLPGVDIVGFTAGGVEGLRITEIASAITNRFTGSLGIGLDPVAGTRLTLPQESDAVTPTLAFGDGDTGFYEASDDALWVSVGGGKKILFSGTEMSGVFGGSFALYPQINASSSVPTIVPSRSDSNTGIGLAAADQLSLIAGGVERLRLNSLGATAGVLNVNETVIGSSINIVGHEGVSLHHDGTEAFLTSADNGTTWQDLSVHASGFKFILSGTTEKFRVDASGTTLSDSIILNNGTTIVDGAVQFDRTNEDLSIGDGSASQIIHMGDWKTWTPVFAGFSTDPSSVIARYTQTGKMVTVWVSMANGTSNATTFTITLPFAAASEGRQYHSLAQVVDNGAFGSVPGLLKTIVSSITADLFQDAAQTAWTNAGGKRANFSLTYEIN